MKTRLIYYLVDDQGTPLSTRYQAAVARLHDTFVRGFRRLRDPADISNAVEETARRIARYEAEHGPVRNLQPFFVRVFTNVVNSMVRSGRYPNREMPTPDPELEILAAYGLRRPAEKVENTVLIHQVLNTLDERKR